MESKKILIRKKMKKKNMDLKSKDLSLLDLETGKEKEDALIFECMN
jgi:hypothetical protein